MGRKLGVVARAKVDRVVDGDTVDVHLVIPVRVRLKDCWAPEMTGDDRVAGAASKAKMEELLPVGSEVHLDIETTEVDALLGVMTFGRVVGQIYHADQEKSVSEMMIEAGMATKEGT